MTKRWLSGVPLFRDLRGENVNACVGLEGDYIVLAHLWCDPECIGAWRLPHEVVPLNADADAMLAIAKAGR